MDTENVELPKELIQSIKQIVDKTGMFKDANDFVNDAVMKQLRRYKDI